MTTLSAMNKEQLHQALTQELPKILGENPDLKPEVSQTMLQILGFEAITRELEQLRAEMTQNFDKVNAQLDKMGENWSNYDR